MSNSPSLDADAVSLENGVLNAIRQRFMLLSNAYQLWKQSEEHEGQMNGSETDLSLLRLFSSRIGLDLDENLRNHQIVNPPSTSHKAQKLKDGSSERHSILDMSRRKDFSTAKKSTHSSPTVKPIHITISDDDSSETVPRVSVDSDDDFQISARKHKPADKPVRAIGRKSTKTISKETVEEVFPEKVKVVDGTKKSESLVLNSITIPRKRKSSSQSEDNGSKRSSTESSQHVKKTRRSNDESRILVNVGQENTSYNGSFKKATAVELSVSDLTFMSSYVDEEEDDKNGLIPQPDFYNTEFDDDILLERTELEEDIDVTVLVSAEKEKCINLCNQHILNELGWSHGTPLLAKDSNLDIDKARIFAVIEALMEDLIVDEEAGKMVDGRRIIDMPFASDSLIKAGFFTVTENEIAGKIEPNSSCIARVPFMPRERRRIQKYVRQMELSKRKPDWQDLSGYLFGRKAKDCETFTHSLRQKGDYDLWILSVSSNMCESSNESGDIPWLLDRTRIHQAKLSSDRTLNSMYKLSHVITESSGSVLEIVSRRSALGTQVIIGSATLQPFGYNRSGNLLVHNIENRTTRVLHGHCLQMEQTGYYTEGDVNVVCIPEQEHPRNIDHLLQSNFDDVYYRSVTDVKDVGENQIASAGNDGSIAIWSMDGALERILYGSIKSTKSGRGFCYEASQAQLHDYNSFSLNLSSNSITSRREQRPVHYAEKPDEVPSINRLAVHPRERHLLASCVSDGSIFLWDTRGSQAPHSLKFAEVVERRNGHPSSSRNIRVDCLRSGNNDILHRSGQFNIYRNGFALDHSEIRSCADIVFGTGLSADRLFVGFEKIDNKSSSGLIRGYDIITQEHILDFSDLKDIDISSLAVSRSGTFIAAGSNGDGILRILDTQSFEVTAEMKNKQYDVNAVSISPCELFVASGGTDNQIFLYDRRFYKRPIYIFEHDTPCDIRTDDGVNTVIWSANSEFLYTAGSDGIIRIWNPVRGSDPLISKLDTVEGGGIGCVSLVKQYVGGEVVVDDTTLCCGTETGKVCVFTKDSSIVSAWDDYSII